MLALDWHFSVRDPNNAILDPRLVEVEEQAKLETAEAQVGQELRGVNGKQFCHDFEFHHDAMLDEQVEPVAQV